MEKMPYCEELDGPAAGTDGTRRQVASSSWRAGVPVLCGTQATLRELRLSDAPSLLAMLSTEEVTRFISPPPTTIEGFKQFILWTYQQRLDGKYVCFAVVPDGYEDAIGLFQVRQLDPTFRSADWGFAIGSPFWGSGIFAEAARLVVRFVFETLGTRRLEARASVDNGRGNGALKKIGAVQEGMLRKSFFRHGRFHDQVLWTILLEDWKEAGATHVH